MKKINLAITGCLGRMGQQIIKSSRLSRDFKVVSITENKILKIRLERTHKKNALTEKMYLELGNLINNSSKDPDVNVILICGGDDFTAGNDLNDFIQNPPTDANSPVFQFMLALTR